MKHIPVAAVRTSPDTVFDDYYRLMHLASYTDYIDQRHTTALNIDLSWHHFTPACSTAPWQLDGVIQTLLADGFTKDSIVACFPERRGITSEKGQVLNRHRQVIQRHGIGNVHLAHDGTWTAYQPKSPMRVLSDVFPDGIPVPEQRIGANALHLPTMKTDVLGTIAGAVYTIFEGLLDSHSTDAYHVLHEAYVDALALEKELSPGCFAIMDGVIAGEGASPRCPVPHEKNVLLASPDPVALDTVAAHMMGIDPMTVPYIRIAHEAGVGTGTMADIELIGDPIDDMKSNFRIDDTGKEARFRKKEATRNGRQPSLVTRLRSFVYHDMTWFKNMREDFVRDFRKGAWGNLFESYRTRVD